MIHSRGPSGCGKSTGWLLALAGLDRLFAAGGFSAQPRVWCPSQEYVPDLIHVRFKEASLVHSRTLEPF